MKEYLALLAKYNAHVNRQLYAIAAKLTAEQRSKEVGSFFKSLLGLLNHIYSADLGWLVRLNEKLGPFAALDAPELKDTLPERGAMMFGEFATLETKRAALDAVIERFVAAFPESDLKKSFSFTLRNGQQRTLVVWQALAHLFNHETHHRGAVAQILDEFGVENDYSNVMSIL